MAQRWWWLSCGSRRKLLGSGEILVGSSIGCNIVIPAGEGVAARHARISFYRQRVAVHDLNSGHGTRIDGEPVTVARELEPGQTVQIGRVELSLSEASRLDGPTADAMRELAADCPMPWILVGSI